LLDDGFVEIPLRESSKFRGHSLAALTFHHYPFGVASTRDRQRAAPMWTKSAPARHRRDQASKKWAADVLALLAGIGFGVVIALVIYGETGGALHSPGGWFIAVGRFAGFTGAYLMLVMIVLIARLPWLERAVGQDRLVRWHRTIGGWPIALIFVHVVAITLGYAQLTSVGPLHELRLFLFNYPDMLAAMVAFGLLLLAGVSSWRIARRRMKYETWWTIHLYIYVALALAFAHQIVTGVVFLQHPLTRYFWIALWSGAAGAVLLSRFVVPIARNLRYQLHVVDVTNEAPGVFSVTMAGKHLSKLAVSGGQFFQWRFFAKDLVWHSHPYSLSALPQPPFLRITVKGLGDQSNAVSRLKPGTRVYIEGPYGTFTRHARSLNRVTLIGAGVGITPLRALLEDLSKDVDVAVVIRASRPEDLVHRGEVASLVEARGGRFHEMIGPRHEVCLDAQTLRALVPYIGASDVYVCGPDGFTNDIVAAVRTLGVDPKNIHHEAFSF
jgi:predicted ferric reductase